MEIVSNTTLYQLLQPQPHPCLSLFLPMVQAGKETRQNPIRFKNVLGTAEQRLAAAGVEPDERHNLLKPLQQLLTDNDFWQHQNASLAAFRSADTLHIYEIPVPLEEEVVVSASFYLKPILPVLTGDSNFFVLALSENLVRLFAGTRYGLEERSLPEDTPRSMQEALAADDPEKQLQARSSAPVGKGNTQAAIYHGHNDPDERVNLLRYFLEVDRGVQAVLRDEQGPLVLAAVAELLPLYHERNTYPHIIDDALTGNPDTLQPHELHAQVWEVIQPSLQQEQQEAASRLIDPPSPDLVSEDLRAILPAAAYGRVDTLFVPSDMQHWGTFDKSTNTLNVHEEHHPGDEDLFNLAALYTLHNSGTVYVVGADEMPGDGVVGALFRYAEPAQQAVRSE